MPPSLKELRLMRDVLVNLATISSGSRRTLTNLINAPTEKNSEARENLEIEVATLTETIEATNSLADYYEKRVHEETERKALRRHMEEARILTDTIRSIRRDQHVVDRQVSGQYVDSRIRAQDSRDHGEREEQMVSILHDDYGARRMRVDRDDHPKVQPHAPLRRTASAPIRRGRSKGPTLSPISENPNVVRSTDGEMAIRTVGRSGRKGGKLPV